MKRIKKVLSLLTMILVTVMLTGCLSIDMKVGKNGSLDMTYTIDTAQTQGMMPFEDIEKALEEFVRGMNDSAGKKVAKLKSVKENKSKNTVTAIINVTDINKMGDTYFFGTVKEYRKNKDYNLDNLVDVKDKGVDEKKVSDKLQMVYFPMGGIEEYGLVVTVTVPGDIQYITDSGEVDKQNVAIFSSHNPLVIYKKAGRFPFWLLLIIAVVVVVFLMMKKKSPSTPISTAPIAGTPQAPVQQTPPQNAAPREPISQAPVQPTVEAPAGTNSEVEASVEPQTNSENNPT